MALTARDKNRSLVLFSRTFFLRVAVSGVLIVFSPSSAVATESVTHADLDGKIKGVLGLVSVSIIPNESANAIVVTSGNDDTRFLATQFGGSDSFGDQERAYIEGYFGAARFDPTFLISDGDGATGAIEARWTNLGGTGGLGWNFRLSEEVVLRPIVNLSLAHATSSANLIGEIIGPIDQSDVDFLENGNVNILGYGGSLMIDWQKHKDEYEADLELRFTQIWMETFGGTSFAVRSAATSSTLGAWSRLRLPTSFTVFDLPVRSVSEISASWLIGEQATALGTDWLSSLGVGFELDLESKKWSPASRARFMGRFMMGDGLSGLSIGIGLSF